jgi:hypothetical protein
MVDQIRSDMVNWSGYSRQTAAGASGTDGATDAQITDRLKKEILYEKCPPSIKFWKGIRGPSWARTGPSVKKQSCGLF